MHNLTYHDANMYIGNWPFHTMRVTKIEDIINMMDRQSIRKGFVSSLDSVFCIDRDLTEVNLSLYDQIKDYTDRLYPFYTICPNVHDASDYLVNLRENYNLKGVRLFPVYHDYSLVSNKILDEMLEKAADLNVPIYITYRFEDERVHHPLAKIPPINNSSLSDFLNNHKQTKMIVGGMRITEIEELIMLTDHPNLYFDLSFIQTPFRSLELLTKTVGEDRVLFGSGLPYWYPECSTLKLETSILEKEQLEKISKSNFESLLT
ncbi:amidohydrolase family protein [Oceanobacillus sp. CF4.6]|uniref:amidohydrolase family protein n=1 Tax=Oceanobacillus sp. CF4.6 TaxID=3373080 RepID=UPI003EE460F2